MARNDGSAYDAAQREAHTIVRDVEAGVLEAIHRGEVTGESDLDDRIHQEIDDALIYTADQWVCAYGLRQERDPFSEGLLETPDSIEQVIGCQAFLNLSDAIDHGSLCEALAVAADAAEETTPEEPREEVTP